MPRIYSTSSVCGRGRRRSSSRASAAIRAEPRGGPESASSDAGVFSRNSEEHLQPELNVAGAGPRGADHAKGRAAERASRIVEVRPVEKVERLDAELHAC